MDERERVRHAECCLQPTLIASAQVTWSGVTVPVGPKNKVAFTFWQGSAVEPPAALRNDARPGDIYVFAHSAAGNDARQGRPMYQLLADPRAADWRLLVDGKSGQGAAAFRHPLRNAHAVRFMKTDPTPRYVTTATWNRAAERAKCSASHRLPARAVLIFQTPDRGQPPHAHRLSPWPRRRRRPPPPARSTPSQTS